MKLPAKLNLGIVQLPPLLIIAAAAALVPLLATIVNQQTRINIPPQASVDWCNPDPAGTRYGGVCSALGATDCGADGRETICGWYNTDQHWYATGNCCAQPTTGPGRMYCQVISDNRPHLEIKVINDSNINRSYQLNKCTCPGGEFPCNECNYSQPGLGAGQSWTESMDLSSICGSGQLDVSPLSGEFGQCTAFYSTNISCIVPTHTPTRVPTSTLIPTRVPTRTPTRAPTRTRTPTPRATRTPTKTPTRAPTRTRTPTPRVATRTPTRVPTRTPTRAPTRTRTPTPRVATRTPTRFPSITRTPTPTTPICLECKIFLDRNSTCQRNARQINMKGHVGGLPVRPAKIRISYRQVEPVTTAPVETIISQVNPNSDFTFPVKWPGINSNDNIVIVRARAEVLDSRGNPFPSCFATADLFWTPYLSCNPVPTPPASICIRPAANTRQ